MKTSILNPLKGKYVFVKFVEELTHKEKKEKKEVTAKEIVGKLDEINSKGIVVIGYSVVESPSDEKLTDSSAETYTYINIPMDNLRAIRISDTEEGDCCEYDDTYHQ